MTAIETSERPSSVLTPSLAPVGLLEKPGAAFMLSSADWLNVQVYVTSALALPTTTDAMHTLLSTDASNPEQASFVGSTTDLQAVYAQISAHCRAWKYETFPSVVDLAGNIVRYNAKVPVYYGALKDPIAALRKGPNAQARKQFKDILDALAREADKYAKKAAEVEAAITSFVAETEQDKLRLDAKNTEYDARLGSQGEESVRLHNDLNAQQQIMDEAIEDYNEAVVIAATTPTYAWVNLLGLPIGLIPAVIVAGIYGQRAEDARKRSEAARDQIATITTQIDRNNRILAIMGRVGQQLDLILANLNSALPVIRKIKDAWAQIAAELKSLTTLVDETIEAALPVTMPALIQKAIGEWAEIARQADAYRVNAFIDVAGESSAA